MRHEEKICHKSAEEVFFYSLPTRNALGGKALQAVNSTGEHLCRGSDGKHLSHQREDKISTDKLTTIQIVNIVQGLTSLTHLSSQANCTFRFGKVLGEGSGYRNADKLR